MRGISVSTLRHLQTDANIGAIIVIGSYVSVVFRYIYLPFPVAHSVL